MLTGRKLKPVIENAAATVKKADDALKLLIGLAVVTLAVVLCTCAVVLGKRAVAHA